MRAWLLGLLGSLANCNAPAQSVASPAPPAMTPPVAASPAVVPPVHRTVASTSRSELEAALSFEGSPPGDHPMRWTTRPEGTSAADATIVHRGHGAIRL